MISTCQTNMIYVWIQMKSQHLRLAFPSSSSSFFFFFFFDAHEFHFLGDIMHYSRDPKPLYL